MRKIILALFKSIIILYILNILTNNYFAFNILNIFILAMLGYPGIIIIYFISLLWNFIINIKIIYILFFKY